MAVNEETAQIFKDFATECENSIVYIEHKAFVGDGAFYRELV